MNTRSLEHDIADLLRALAQPARLSILLSIGEGDACVCHLEALLGLRQAYISQHLMALREAGLLNTRRQGRYVYYSLCEPRILDLIRHAGEIAGVPPPEIEALMEMDSAPNCPCPKCIQARNAQQLISPEQVSTQSGAS